MRGTVKTWVEDKYYGFITPDDGGEDVFVHASAVDGRGLDPGDVVEFGVEDVGRGPRAYDVRVVGAEG